MESINYIKALRPEQWYKNILVFLALIYSSNLFDPNKFLMALLGFAVLSILSSANYALNDMFDKSSDSKNPLKRHRPIASGKISLREASMMIFVLLATGFLLSSIVNLQFFLLMALFVAVSGAYTFFLKKQILSDILVIAVNFVIRAVSGALIIDVYVSPWLVLCPFFLSLFISIGKRKAELSILGKDAAKHRATLSYYKEEVANSLMMITTAILVIAYTFYTLTVDAKLLITLPVVIYGIFRYYHFISQKPMIAANPELALTDKKFTLALIMWLILTFVVLYVNP